MKKTLMIIVALLVFVLPLSAYSVNALRSSDARQIKLEQSSKLIHTNQKKWRKHIAKADVIHSDEFANQSTSVSTSLEQLQNHSQTVIQGTVYNLQKMHSPEGMSYTKATIYVDRVISGDESIKDKNIYLALDGGLVSYDCWYAKNIGKNMDPKHEILVQNDEFPLPTIGSKVITGLVPNHLNETNAYNTALKQSGFTINNSYAIDNPQYDFWVKKPKATKYQLNNPKLRKFTSNQRTKQLQKLTVLINQKYNKK
ncbi:hypothetical protein [Companilactobacillus nantensis]|nr:hypothetical protein [Companilactobacillus nantensis]GEO64835.1 hypothetical protein LNA01_20180 [Companilactobacillus nantensis]